MHEHAAPLELRPARVTDLPAVYRGELDYIQTWEPTHEAAWRLDLERHLTRWSEHFSRLTVAERAGRFAGYALWMPEAGRAELVTLHVAPWCRRQGIAKALLHAYARAAATEGLSQLALSVRHDNPARHLYEQVGFVRTATDAKGYLEYRRQA